MDNKSRRDSIPHYLTHCRFGCHHDRHQKYLELFKDDVFEQHFLWQVAMYVWDANLTPNDADDLDLFQDLVFDSKFGRIHIYFYDHLFDKYYRLNSDWVTTIFVRYLEYLEKLSSLFTNDAFDFVFKKEDQKLVLTLLKKMPLDLRLRFIKHSEKYPNIIQLVPKLKLYNLFS